jgi:hypothetical protein
LFVADIDLIDQLTATPAVAAVADRGLSVALTHEPVKQGLKVNLFEQPRPILLLLIQRGRNGDTR